MVLLQRPVFYSSHAWAVSFFPEPIGTAVRCPAIWSEPAPLPIWVTQFHDHDTGTGCNPASDLPADQLTFRAGSNAPARVSNRSINTDEPIILDWFLIRAIENYSIF